MKSEELRENCLTLRKAVVDGEKWLADNEAAIGGREVERRNLRKSARNLKNYADAATRKTAIAVFGPSQAGKSTLISALAKGPSGNLKVDFGEKVLDFMLNVNPEGGNETTGLVTRFSLDPTPRTPEPSLPVCLKLFSEMDIVKILSNTYFGEAKGGRPIDTDELNKILDDLGRKPATTNRLSLDDIEELAEYVRNISSDYASGQLLINLYWPRAIDLALKLDLSGRAQLFSVLWGGLEPFTRLYIKLYKDLEKLDLTETAFCALNALYDDENGRKKSVLHVDRLMGLLDEGGETVEVISEKGSRASLTRPVLSALIAEMHVRVLEKPGEFMDKADILDFPGYRAREKLTDIVEEIKDPKILRKCFLRGKVAYLFERYCARKEITTMLLCVAESVQNNPDLPIVVHQWIKDTHGSTPEDRAGKPVCLFLVLTKFDRILETGAGSTDTITRWENRYNASFLQFFGGQHWPLEWAQVNGRFNPFNNLFWLLNLKFADSFLNIVEVDKTQEIYRASGIRSEKLEWVQEVRKGYLDTEATRLHVAHPEKAWEAVIESEDGGVGYIIGQLTPILSDNLKIGQLTSLTLAESLATEQVLKDFYQGGDKDEEKDIKVKLLERLAPILTNLARNHLFGLLLKDLQLGDDECQVIFSRPFTEEEIRQEADEPKDEKPFNLDELMFGDSKDPVSSAPPVKFDDTAHRLRRRLEKSWMNQLYDLASDGRSQNSYGLSLEIFNFFVGELIQGARRLGILEEIESRLREALSYGNVNPERLIWKQARIGSALLSSYVNWLGLSSVSLSAEERTVTVRGVVGELFKLSPIVADFPELPEIQTSYEWPYFLDWFKALYRLTINNVDFADKNYDLEQNARLGEIIKVTQVARNSIAPVR